MSTLRADVRAAAVTMLAAYAATASVKLQTYPGRPASINPPCAFVDRISERIEYPGVSLRQRTPSVTITLLHGQFDSKDTVDQADAFMDGFLDWVTANPHAAGGNTIVAVTDVTDDPTYVPDWVRPELQRTYFATQITMEGYAEN